MMVTLIVSSQASAIKENYGQPRIITEGDIYVKSQLPKEVFFDVKGMDSQGNPIPVECDKISGQKFPVGKTTVRCLATEPTNKEVRSSFVVTVGYNIVQIPSWFKTTAQFWADNLISDKEFTHNIEFLMKDELIHIPTPKPFKSDPTYSIPEWIKFNAKSWADGKISNDEFSMGLQWMIKNGIIKSV